MPVQTIIRTRRSSAATWASVNPILAAGEKGIESDTNKEKVGDGTTAWSSLSYHNPGGEVPQSQVTNLTTDLAGKAASSHTHPIADLTSFSVTTPANKQVLQYDSTSSLWKNATISAGVAVSETAPSTPASGDLWFSSADAKTYIYYDSAWVELSPAVQGATGPQGPAGADGATGASGVISVTSPIVNSGTSTSAALSLNQALLALSTSQVTQAISDKTANYSIVSGDVGKLIRSTNSAITITIDNVLTAGQRIDFAQYGSGQITFAAGSGVTINSADNNLKTAKQYAGVTVECVASGIYWLVGNLGA